MFYKKPVGRVQWTQTYYKKKFDHVYFWGGIIAAIVILVAMGG